ncbi:MAG: hypothetical protein ACR2QE_06050 [Acidimicrobiales bacterium]
MAIGSTRPGVINDAVFVAAAHKGPLSSSSCTEREDGPAERIMG